METVVDREALDTGALQRAGGLKKTDRVFEGRHGDVLTEIRGEIWKTAG